MEYSYKLEDSENRIVELESFTKALRKELKIITDQLAQRTILYDALDRQFHGHQQSNELELKIYERNNLILQTKYEELFSNHLQIKQEKEELLLKTKDYQQIIQILEKEKLQVEEVNQSLTEEMNQVMTQNRAYETTIEHYRNGNYETVNALELQKYQENNSLAQQYKAKEEEMVKELNKLNQLLRDESYRREELIQVNNQLSHRLQERDLLLTRIEQLGLFKQFLPSSAGESTEEDEGNNNNNLTTNKGGLDPKEPKEDDEEDEDEKISWLLSPSPDRKTITETTNLNAIFDIISQSLEKSVEWKDFWPLLSAQETEVFILRLIEEIESHQTVKSVISGPVIRQLVNEIGKLILFSTESSQDALLERLEAKKKTTKASSSDPDYQKYKTKYHEIKEFAIQLLEKVALKQMISYSDIPEDLSSQLPLPPPPPVTASTKGATTTSLTDSQLDQEKIKRLQESVDLYIQEINRLTSQLQFYQNENSQQQIQMESLEQEIEQSRVKEEETQKINLQYLQTYTKLEEKIQSLQETYITEKQQLLLDYEKNITTINLNNSEVLAKLQLSHQKELKLMEQKYLEEAEKLHQSLLQARNVSQELTSENSQLRRTSNEIQVALNQQKQANEELRILLETKNASLQEAVRGKEEEFLKLNELLDQQDFQIHSLLSENKELLEKCQQLEKLLDEATTVSASNNILPTNAPTVLSPSDVEKNTDVPSQSSPSKYLPIAAELHYAKQSGIEIISEEDNSLLTQEAMKADFIRLYNQLNEEIKSLEQSKLTAILQLNQKKSEYDILLRQYQESEEKNQKLNQEKIKINQKLILIEQQINQQETLLKYNNQLKEDFERKLTFLMERNNETIHVIEENHKKEVLTLKKLCKKEISSITKEKEEIILKYENELKQVRLELKNLQKFSEEEKISSSYSPPAIPSVSATTQTVIEKVDRSVDGSLFMKNSLVSQDSETQTNDLQPSNNTETVSVASNNNFIPRSPSPQRRSSQQQLSISSPPGVSNSIDLDKLLSAIAQEETIIQAVKLELKDIIAENISLKNQKTILEENVDVLQTQLIKSNEKILSMQSEYVKLKENYVKLIEKDESILKEIQLKEQIIQNIQEEKTKLSLQLQQLMESSRQEQVNHRLNMSEVKEISIACFFLLLSA